jgi:spectinomycin phosphotransferase
MLEKPNLADATIISCLHQHYGFNITKLEFLPIGYDATAWVYRVDTAAAPYFLKVKKGVLQASSLTIPHFLRDSGITQIVAPLANIHHALWTNSGEFNLILYPFIEGKSGMEIGLSDNQWREFGTVLKRIHDTTLAPELVQQIHREDFAPLRSDIVREMDAYIANNTFDNPHKNEFAALWQEKRAEILKITARCDELANMLKRQPLDFVLCHSDIHTANILVDAAGHLHIVDWDDVQLAPKERDLMFVLDGGHTEPKSDSEQWFLEGYGQTGINAVAFAYYRYEWVVQEFADFAQRVYMLDDVGDETRADSIRGFKQLFDAADVIDVAYRTEGNLPQTME